MLFFSGGFFNVEFGKLKVELYHQMCFDACQDLQDPAKRLKMTK